MEDIVSQFFSRFVLTGVEQREVILDSSFNQEIKSSKFILVGKLLNDRYFNKEAARAMILQGGPWLFNGYLLALTKANPLITNPSLIPISIQEFWIQVKGLPLAYITSHSSPIIGRELGGYVVMDQSKKSECFGNFLRIQAVVDITKPLQSRISLHLDGILLEVAIWHEKLPITCYRCGVISHTELSCHDGPSPGTDDLVKPYGKWFQLDVFSADYRRPPDWRFELPSSNGWSMLHRKWIWRWTTKMETTLISTTCF
ncbi:PREDICTED: uncharacterized protein LOC103322540 [Prunus mume]|uniref:Uncharacterized protein LOC103322540 n=1 Tax=Prunus mume TaxID=102107 RepID=A0ABM0NCF6_PRUMU|nr:PREDICTED: uncharacterized protein LOC103322540 [Prunus mume]